MKTRLAQTHPLARVRLHAFCLVSILAVLAAPAATADHALTPPSSLEVARQQDDVLLTWEAPIDQTPDAYRIYVDGAPVATQAATWIILPASAVYAITAIYDDHESAPAMALLGPQATDGWCDPMPTTIDGDPPFIHPRPRLECFNWVWELLEDPTNTIDFRR